MPRKDLEHYWPDRVRERDERNLKLTLEESDKELHRLYVNQANELRKNLLEVFSKIQRDEGTPDGIMANDLYRNRRYWALLDYINENLRDLGHGEIRVIEPHLIRLYNETKDALDEEIPSELKPSFLVPQMIDAKDVVNQTWCLDGKEFSDRIWDNKSKLLVQLKKSMSDFLVRGRDPWSIADRLAGVMETSEYNAYRIVRTESAHLQIKGKTDRYKELGFTKGRVLAEHCCDDCKRNNNKVFTLEELSTLLPVHPNCTCTFTLVNERTEAV